MRVVCDRACMTVRSQITFAKFLRQIMEDTGTRTVSDLAAMLDCEPQTVGRYLSGTGGEPSLDNLRRMAPGLGLRLVDVMILAGVATPEEMGTKAQPAQPLPVEIRRIVDLINDPMITDYYRRVLLDGVAAAGRFFLDLFRPPVGAAETRPSRARVRAG